MKPLYSTLLALSILSGCNMFSVDSNEDTTSMSSSAPVALSSSLLSLSSSATAPQNSSSLPQALPSSSSSALPLSSVAMTPLSSGDTVITVPILSSSEIVSTVSSSAPLSSSAALSSDTPLSSVTPVSSSAAFSSDTPLSSATPVSSSEAAPSQLQGIGFPDNSIGQPGDAYRDTVAQVDFVKQNDAWVVSPSYSIEPTQLKYLHTFGLTANELITHGANYDTLVSIGVPSLEIINSTIGVDTLLVKRHDGTELYEAGIPIDKFLEYEYQLKELKKFGFGIDDFAQTTLSFDSVAGIGYSYNQLAQVGYHVSEFLENGAALHHIIHNGGLVIDLKEMGYTLEELVESGAHYNNLLKAGFTITELETVDITGTIIDSRDGNEYRWVKIKNYYWFAQNLNYSIEGHESICASDDVAVDAEECGVHGRMYGADYGNRDQEGEFTLCPEGWKIPTISQHSTISSAAYNTGYVKYGLKLLSEDMGGSDLFGFNLSLLGYMDNNGTRKGVDTDVYLINDLPSYAGDVNPLSIGLSGSVETNGLNSDFKITLRCMKEESPNAVIP
ncbi:MAG: hypothetical protein OCC49_15940 [Fibrobacterales bacterium]